MAFLITLIVPAAVLGTIGLIFWKMFADAKRDRKNYERALKMVPMLIHLPPSTDDIQGNGRDGRDVTDEALSEAQVMYSIISSTLKKGLKSKLYGQKHISFEIVACDGLINYYAIVPAVLTETVKQAITAAYPTARLEEVDDPNIFNAEGKIEAVVGGELRLKEDYWYPIATYEDTRRDASLAMINAMSVAKKGDGLGVQVMFRPTDGGWTRKALQRVQNIKDGKKGKRAASNLAGRAAYNAGNLMMDFAKALWEPPEEHDKYKDNTHELTNLQQEEIQKIEEKTKHPGFECLIRIIASSATKERSEALLGGVVSVFSQFDLPSYNGFRYDILKNNQSLAKEYIMRIFPQTQRSMILNSVEMASLFHLPAQNAIPTSQVERQKVKQVDGPARLVEDGVILGVNEFRGEQKVIRLSDTDRGRHTYIIGSTGSGKSVLLENIAYQDMCDGRGFCFVDPHGDAVEWLLSRVPPERMDDVILFEPSNMDNPVGMNMLEFTTEDQKDFIVQEGISMMLSLFDPNNEGIFGPRAQHMFRNAALLLMSDPKGGTFIEIPRCFVDADFVIEKLKYVTDKTVYDYWTKEFPATQRSSEAGDLTSWFASKWGPFLSNKMMRNILGQVKSGFNLREIMDQKKILLVNLSKGTTGEQNAKLLGMIFVMKFQAAAMSRADVPEDQRPDFCLFVDEFQNFATESFESILSEARKYHLNLILANQFMTQLTDKIREAILGNVGTIMSGRLGVTDAELMEKAFTPVFNAEDLHKQPNHNWIVTVLMFGMPSSPFTLRSLPPMGEAPTGDFMQRMKAYALSRHGRPRAEVEAEIDERLAVGSERSKPKKSETATATASERRAEPSETKSQKSTAKTSAAQTDVETKKKTEASEPKKNFLDAWLERKAENEQKAKEEKRKELAASAAAEKAGVTPSARKTAPIATPVVPSAQKTAPIETPIAPHNATPIATPQTTMTAPSIESPKATAKVAGSETTPEVVVMHSAPNVAPEATAANVAPPTAQGQSVAGGGVKTEEDGAVVLRWR